MSLLPSVLFKEEDYWIVNKPAGMSFHAESQDVGFMQWLHEAYPNELFYPVHRLDRITSGLIILAKHKKAAQVFGQLFEQHLVTKYYLALSAKKPKKKQGTIKGGMQQGRRGSWLLNQSNTNLAHTQFFSCLLRPGIRLFVLKPRTGKTHQLRVALKSVGAPILGDERYSGEASDRGYLHAYSLCFEWQGVIKVFEHLPEIGVEFEGVRACLIENGFDQLNDVPWPK
jgi:tRNA pseudouridine32 synthase/23S rRNA pseudouridine746 synthase